MTQAISSLSAWMATKNPSTSEKSIWLQQSERVRKLAAGIYKTQVELANAAGVVPLTVNRVWKARGPLTRETAEKLAPALKTTPAYLIYGAVTPDKPDGRHGKTPDAVRQYLTSEFGRDAVGRVAKMLETLDYASIGLLEVTPKDVHRVREMIEVNLAIARKRHS